MKLTKQQIDQLYQFTIQHYVEWYDLQTELVDHLANSIEEQWQQNPKLSFEEALQLEFKKFGVCGFMDVVEERRVSLNKKYNKIVWKHFKDFFSIPKIIMTFPAIFVLFYILNLDFYQSDILLFLFSFIVFSFLGIIIYRKIKDRKYNTFTCKKWLFKEIIFNYSSFAGLTYLPVQILLNSDKVIQTKLGISIISILIISLILFNYIILIIIPSKAEEYLRETYPEYELANTL